jgi:hypothetical protein
MSTYSYTVVLTETRTQVVSVAVDIGDGDSFDPKFRHQAAQRAKYQCDPEAWSRPEIASSPAYWQRVAEPTALEQRHAAERTELARRHAKETKELEADQS